jgi:hypothetical protein
MVEINMIRFVDIRGQGTSYRFAFWDTTRDKFCEFSGDQAWESATDFAESFDMAGGKFADMVRESGIERFTILMPDWTATPMGEDDEP